MYEEFLRLILASKPAPEASLSDAARLSHVYSAMAAVDRRAGRNDLASALDSRRIELWQRWKLKLPNNDFVRRQLSAETAKPGFVISRTVRFSKVLADYANTTRRPMLPR
jgi:hypothetical protein